MWPWIKRWRDWVMNDLLPTYRIGAQPRALHFSFEKAGLVLHDQPIPWNAEAVLGEESVACQTFVSTQCKGLLASAVLTSPTSLVPLADVDFHVDFRSEPNGSAISVPVRLSSTQLTGRQALLTVAPHKHPRRIGNW